MLKQRIVSVVIGLPFLVAIFWFGDPWFTLLIAAGAALGSLEFYRMVIPDKRHRFAYFGLPWSVLFILSPHSETTYILPLLITSATVFSLSWFLLFAPRDTAFSHWAWTIAGIFYTGWMLSYWVGLRVLTDGKYWALLALFATFASDTSAFFIGRTWGKRPLAAKISPGKTWEGAIGGVLGAIAACLIFKNIFPLPIAYWQGILLGFLVSLFAQLGDLVESLLKRNTGVKDSGKLIPGHGGILDRIDSLIFTGVVVYYYAIWTIM